MLCFLREMAKTGTTGCRLLGMFVALACATAALPQTPGVWAWGLNESGQLGDGTTTDRFLAAQVQAPAGTIAVAAGTGHSLALMPDGTVLAWGLNEFGQLGDGTTTDRLTPVPVQGLTGVVEIRAGNLHSMARKSDGTVWAWGGNSSGQLGDGTTTDRLVPVQVSGLTSVVEISAGLNHSLARRSNGTVWAWGDNVVGQLGDGSTEQRNSPVQVSGLTNAASIGAGALFSVAARSDGSVWGWGWNARGQLGDGTEINRWTPVQTVGLTQVVAVAAGGSHGIALRSTGSVWSWGWNARGQMGNGTSGQTSWPYQTTPVQTTGLSGVQAIAGGSMHSLALMGDGTVRAWGANDYGVLGDGTEMDRLTPVQTIGLSDVEAISAGSFHNLAIGTGMAGGPTVDWPGNQAVDEETLLAFTVSGSDPDGLALSFTLDSDSLAKGMTLDPVTGAFEWTPSEAQDGPHGVAIYATNTDGGIGVTSFTITVSEVNRPPVLDALPERIVVWGLDPISFLATATDPDTVNPGALPNTLTFALDAASQAAGMQIDPWSGAFLWVPSPGDEGVYQVTVTVEDDGTPSLQDSATIEIRLRALAGPVYAWGYGAFGTLGTGGTSLAVSPTQSLTPPQMVTLDTGARHVLAVHRDGSVWSWGNNWSGQLGDGVSVPAPQDYPAGLTPRQIAGLTDVVAVAAGGQHSLALHKDGTVSGWGSNTYGQLGDGIPNPGNHPRNRLVPGPVPGLTDIVAIAAGQDCSFAVRSDGVLFGFGRNRLGPNINVLGLPTEEIVYSPTEIPLPGPVKAVSILSQHALILLEDGTVWTTGGNHAGQRGTGDTVYYPEPTPVPGLSNVRAVAAGVAFSLALHEDGAISAWGLNSLGQLGDGTTVGQLSPLPIASLSGVRKIAAGNDHALAIREDGTLWAWGNNTHGQLGLGYQSLSEPTPQVVPGLANVLHAAASQGQPGGSGSTAESFSAVVVRENEAPQLDSIGNRSVNELQHLSFTVSAFDADYDAFTFSLDATSLAEGMMLDPVTGAFSWNPTEAQDGPHTVTITVSDGVLTDSETFTIMVNEINTPPTLHPVGDKSVEVLTQLAFVVTASDPDTVNPGQVPNTLIFRLDTASEAKGMTMDESTGAFSWTPGVPHLGTHTVHITVVDDGVPNMGDAETITITVTSSNEPPVLDAIGNKSVDEEATLAFTATASDPNSGDSLTFALDADSVAKGMTINASTGAFSWTPTEAQDGPHSVTVTVTDDGAPNLSASETITITVNEINQPPVLNPIGDHAVDEQQELTFTVTASDPDTVNPGAVPNTLSYLLDAVSQVKGMTLDATTGEFRWTPTAAQVGTHEVTIGVRDDGNPVLEDVEVFTITVRDVSLNVWGWGFNGNGRIGDGTTDTRHSPVNLPNAADIVAVSAGIAHSIALGSDGSVWTWGRNDEGQLGDGTLTARLEPVRVTGVPAAKAVAAGGFFSMALTEDGQVYTWGMNQFGQLGIGFTQNQSVPMLVTSLVGFNVVAVAAGSTHALAVDSNGGLYAWGNNSSGQLGAVGQFSFSWVPAHVPSLTDVVSVSAGGAHSLAVLANGNLFAWGSNSHGQLGVGTGVSQTVVPTLVMGDTRSVAAGLLHSLFLLRDGTLGGAGQNDFGQLGDGTTTDRFWPVGTQVVSGVHAIAAGTQFSLAILNDGSLWTWGANGSGQLGLGHTQTQLIPNRVPGLGPVGAISAGNAHALAATADLPRVSGHVVLEDLAISPASVPVVIEIHPLGSSAVLQRFDPSVGSLLSDGSFSLPTHLQGTFDITVSAPGWLRRRLTAVVIGPDGVSGLSAFLHSGDANGDNSVNLQDFLFVRAAFGTSAGSPNWNPNADFNKDGSVNLVDFLIVRRNFGKMGD